MSKISKEVRNDIITVSIRGACFLGGIACVIIACVLRDSVEASLLTLGIVVSVYMLLLFFNDIAQLVLHVRHPKEAGSQKEFDMAIIRTLGPELGEPRLDPESRITIQPWDSNYHKESGGWTKERLIDDLGTEDPYLFNYDYEPAIARYPRLGYLQQVKGAPKAELCIFQDWLNFILVDTILIDHKNENIIYLLEQLPNKSQCNGACWAKIDRRSVIDLRGKPTHDNLAGRYDMTMQWYITIAMYTYFNDRRIAEASEPVQFQLFFSTKDKWLEFMSLFSDKDGYKTSMLDAML